MDLAANKSLSEAEMVINTLPLPRPPSGTFHTPQVPLQGKWPWFWTWR